VEDRLGRLARSVVVLGRARSPRRLAVPHGPGDLAIGVPRPAPVISNTWRGRQVAAAVSAMAAPDDLPDTHRRATPRSSGGSSLLMRRTMTAVSCAGSGLLETGKGRPVPDDVKVYVGEWAGRVACALRAAQWQAGGAGEGLGIYHQVEDLRRRARRQGSLTPRSPPHPDRLPVSSGHLRIWSRALTEGLHHFPALLRDR
jgi:hypothetical protein